MPGDRFGADVWFLRFRAGLDWMDRRSLCQRKTQAQQLNAYGRLLFTVYCLLFAVYYLRFHLAQRALALTGWTAGVYASAKLRRNNLMPMAVYCLLFAVYYLRFHLAQRALAST